MTSPVVCGEVSDLFERQVRGRLSAADAAALASHTLGCERCAAAMRRVTEIDVEAGRPIPPRAAGATGSAWRARRPLAIAVAAIVVAALAGTTIWQTATRPRVRQAVVRGRGGDLPLVAMWRPDGTLRLTWPRTPGSTKYDVRLTGSTGREMSKVVTQPVLVLQPQEVPALGQIDVVIESAMSSGEHVSRSTRLRPSTMPTSP